MAFAMGAGGQRAEINVTPLIDVLLVLLIIFMVITPVAQRGLKSALPQGKAAREVSLPPVVVEIGGDGGGLSYRVDRRAVSADELEETIRGALAARQERVVFVRAGRGLTFAPVAAMVAMAKAAGATTVSIGG